MDRPLTQLPPSPILARPETAGLVRPVLFLGDPSPGFVRLRLIEDGDRAELRPLDFFIEQDQFERALADYREARDGPKNRGD